MPSPAGDGDIDAWLVTPEGFDPTPPMPTPMSAVPVAVAPVGPRRADDPVRRPVVRRVPAARRRRLRRRRRQPARLLRPGATRGPEPSARPRPPSTPARAGAASTPTTSWPCSTPPLARWPGARPRPGRRARRQLRRVHDLVAARPAPTGSRPGAASGPSTTSCPRNGAPTRRRLPPRARRQPPRRPRRVPADVAGHLRAATSPRRCCSSTPSTTCGAPPSRPTPLFVALRLLGRPDVEYWRFPGEGHELSRSGSPAHRVRRAELINAFFERTLGAGPR